MTGSRAMFLLSSVTFKAALPRGVSPLWDVATKCITQGKPKMLPGMAPTPLPYLGCRGTNPIVHMERTGQIFGVGRRIFLQSSLGNAAQSHSQGGKTFLPCCSHKDKVLSRLPTAPGEGRGAALMLWLGVTSAHPGWRCYQSLCRTPCKAALFALKHKCFVSAWFKETARLLEIKRMVKKKKKNLMAAGFPVEHRVLAALRMHTGVSMATVSHLSRAT